MPENLLGNETSPYLLQYKDNPVHWRPWGEDALNLAQQQNKPILLSIGYSACHWCHIMAHESFEDLSIASLMNQRFINIKVDREERPDLDNIYQSALNMMGLQGGWPLTMFLDGKGKPFWGGTYFPPTTKYGRPGFDEVLQQTSDVFSHQPEKIEINTSRISAALQQQINKKTRAILNTAKIDQATQSALEMMDPQYGGTCGAPKFPQPVFLKYLWLEYLKTGNPAIRHHVTLSLDNICQGGIYDHIGGGFARYSVDEAWLVPHFEKMLYDNALLVELLGEVWKVTQSPIYKERIEETIDWMISDLRIDHGDGFGLASARDADSEGIEGKFYIWSKTEIEEILDDDAALFCEIYNISEPGNWEGNNISHRKTTEKQFTNDDQETLARSRKKVFDVRSRRIQPLRDHKILVDWNALAISALVRSSCRFKPHKYLGFALQIYGFLKANLFHNDQLFHSWCDGQSRHTATLDDYANLARASLDLYQATTELKFLHDAITMVLTTNQNYWDQESNGYFFSHLKATDIFMRNKVIFDNATPSGNGVMLEVLARLFIITGQAEYNDRARRLIAATCPDDPRGIINQPSLVIGHEILETTAQIIIALPDNKNPTSQALFLTALGNAPFHYIVCVVHPDQSLPEGHPAADKHALDGKPTAYICRNQICALPITDCNELADALSSMS